ncbi:uncharacterized protein LOC110699722 isoform X2 [Chenopodium quinoa]|uniref:uncharacterized protein LOC110699722 isoform X2 n=1 Tax=Chenopodium quinoa TaxID=63459 RepID=UPI000B7969B7|nr:uncharacterized protein LOC110699722 isoform X2 [Chenopodium quinoa]
MQINGFYLALWLFGFLLMTFNSSSGVMLGDTNTVTTTIRSRYLKENRFGFIFAQGNSNGDVNLEDYGPVDPSPSQASIDHGPIEHGSPSHPYIPKPKPPPPAPIPSRP